MFNDGQKIWMVQKYTADPSPTKVRRQFLKKFGIVVRKKNNFKPTKFSEVIKRFQNTGSVQDGRKKNSGVTETDPAFCEEIFEAVAKMLTISVKRLSMTLNASKYKVYRTLKVNL